MGRRTLCTPELTQRISALLAYGATITDACRAEGIHIDSFMSWRARGEAEQTRMESEPDAEPNEHEAPFTAFAEAVEHARGTAKLRAIELIHTAYDGWDETVTVEKQRVIAEGVEVIERTVTTARKFDWRAGLTFLERRYPEEWGRRMNRMETPAEAGAQTELTEAAQSTEELLSLGIAVLERERERRAGTG